MTRSREPAIRLRAGALEHVKRTTGTARDEDLAVRIGVSRATYTRVKTGQLAPSPHFMAGLASLAGLTLGQLFEVPSERVGAGR